MVYSAIEQERIGRRRDGNVPVWVVLNRLKEKEGCGSLVSNRPYDA